MTNELVTFILSIIIIWKGGIRAVVWTDAFQVGIMIAAVLTVTSLGTYEVGGPSEVWKKALEAKRIQFLKFIK